MLLSSIMLLCIFYMVSLFFCLFYYKNSFMFFLVVSEFISLVLFFIFSIFSFYYSFSFDGIFLFLSIVVIEGGVGLCTLIYVIYKGGDDKMFGSMIFY